MRKEEFEELLRDVLPHAQAIRESLERHNVPGTRDVRINKDGYTNFSCADAEYTQFKAEEEGWIRFSWPFEL